MDSKFIAIGVVAVLAIAGVGYAIYAMGGDDNNGIVGEDVDFVGRSIQPVENVDDGIVAIGQDSFRWMTYFGLADKCVMIDTNDRTNFMGKAFMYIGRALADVSETDLNDYTHANCAITAGDVSHIMSIEPSVVVVPEGFYTDYANEYKSLVDYGLNVVSIGYIYTFLEPGTFEITERMNAQIDLLSNVFSNVLDTDRGQELKDGINSTVSDIRAMAGTVTTQKSAYIGAIAYNGAHGTDSSMTYYMPFALAGIRNIMDDGTYSLVGSDVKTFSATTIKEKITSDTILFLDGTGIYMCTDNTSKGIIQLFEGHEAYVACPYIWTGMNFESVLISAYQVMKDAYGTLTQAQFEAKVNAIHDLFLGDHISNRDIVASTTPVPAAGTTVYQDMNNLYMTMRGNPISGAITIASDGTLSFA